LKNGGGNTAAKVEADLLRDRGQEVGKKKGREDGREKENNSIREEEKRERRQ
jgi:hypothetical protein